MTIAIPTIMILGRTNAGKSTLFNRLVKRRKNIVHDAPGVTRDFLEKEFVYDDVRMRLVDTAGFEPNGSWSYPEVQEGIRRILGDADTLLYVIDGNEDVNPIDRDALRALKKTGKPIVVAVNKIDGTRRADAAQVFHELGVQPLYFISSEHGLGISDLLEAVIQTLNLPKPEVEEELPAHLRPKKLRRPLEDWELSNPLSPTLSPKGRGSKVKDSSFLFPPNNPPGTSSLDPKIISGQGATPLAGVGTASQKTKPIKIAIVGRPNVGKSTLSNELYGKYRMVVSERPGTTRDAVTIDVTWKEKCYTFIDTAGIRRPGRREDFIEKVSVSQSLREIKDADVALWVIDAERGLEEQDKRVLGEILEEHKPFVVLCNKWDAVLKRDRNVPTRELEKRFRETLEHECAFIPYAPIIFVSAETGLGKDDIFRMIDKLYAESQLRFSTGEVNRRLERIFKATPPPTKAGKPVRIFYGTQVAHAPPTFVFFANYPKYIENSYRRFLENAIRRDFAFKHIPILVQVRGRSKEKKD